MPTCQFLSLPGISLGEPLREPPTVSARNFPMVAAAIKASPAKDVSCPFAMGSPPENIRQRRD
ncbi:MAG: hypothetical protein AAF989_08935 [Planctomycetota bacterium]